MGVSEHAGHNASERRAILETRNVGADPNVLWGRPPLVERKKNERQSSTSPAGVMAMACVKEESTSNTGNPGGEGA